jgi:hypothetical protein
VKFIDSKVHRYFYLKVCNFGADYKLVKMTGLLSSLADRNGQRYGMYGIPRREIKEWSMRLYRWPYLHGYVIEGGYFLIEKIRNWRSDKKWKPYRRDQDTSSTGW